VTLLFSASRTTYQAQMFTPHIYLLAQHHRIFIRTSVYHNSLAPPCSTPPVVIEAYQLFAQPHRSSKMTDVHSCSLEIPQHQVIRIQQTERLQAQTVPICLLPRPVDESFAMPESWSLAHRHGRSKFVSWQCGVSGAACGS
jgi:hypothetical protein